MLTFNSFIEQYIVRTNLELNESDEALSSSKLLIREARRRGWSVDSYGDGLIRFLDGEDIIGGANYGISSVNSQLAVTTCNRKTATKSALALSGIPVANGKGFKVKNRDLAKEYFSNEPKPLVMKSSTGSMGDSVSVNLNTMDDFDRAWEKAHTGLKANSIILIEEQKSGIDIRAYIVEGKFVAAVTRVPAFVIGDGRSTVDELVSSLVEARKKNSYMRSLPVKIDDNWLSAQNLSRSSVPRLKQVVTLNQTANTHQGASNFGITNMISPALAQLAEESAKAIPGANAVGIDLMIESLEDPKRSVVLEANASASLLLHHYPAYGEEIDVARTILDTMERQYCLFRQSSSSK